MDTPDAMRPAGATASVPVRLATLGGLAPALILGMVALALGVESVMRLLQPTTVQFGTATLIAIAGLIVNIVSALLLCTVSQGTVDA